MKGDFTRFTFDPKRHYKSVLMQQGRVVLDADWNEQAGIEEHIRETEIRDVVGRCGSPIGCAGFKVDVAPGGQDLILSSGRMYVDGILCELDENLAYFKDAAFNSEDSTMLSVSDGNELELEKKQWVEITARIDIDRISDLIPERPFIQEKVLVQVLRIKEIAEYPDSNKMALTFYESVNQELKDAAESNGIYIKSLLRIEPQPGMGGEPSGTFLAHLDVWNRHITAVEDDNIREKALSGPDTCTRTKAEWRVKLTRWPLKSTLGLSCHQASLILKDLIDLGPSRLAARLQIAQEEATDASTRDLCVALSGASYKGLENQLYRVEIHQPGGVGEATFKWSRDNGAIAFAIEDFIPDGSKGSETANAEIPAKFHRVKLSRLGWDETLRIHEEDLVEVLGDETELLGKPGTLARVAEIDEADMMLTLTADVAGHANESNPKIRRWDMDKGKMAESSSIEGMPTGASSEDSSWIELEKGIEVRFKAGDQYQTGDYWQIPARNSGKMEWPHDEDDFVPKFGIQHHSCLLAILDLSDGTWKLERDCRKLFSPLSDLVLLSYVGGDGQEAMPGSWLPAPFEVRVTRGDQPLEGAQIAFEMEGQGVLDPVDGFVRTGKDGIASCKCRLGKGMTSPNLRITAKLLDAATADEQGEPSFPSISFNANASIAEQVAYAPPKECIQLGGAKTVKDAIDDLCRQVSFTYAGGDGQEARPGNVLSVPFAVRVARGSYPIEDALVYFSIETGGGELREKKGEGGSVDLKIQTNKNGIAECFFKLDESAVILAKLIDPKPVDKSYIRFSAGVSSAQNTRYVPSEDCAKLKDAKTVKEAIDILCSQNSSTEKTLTTWVHGNSLHLQKIQEKTEGDISLKYDDIEQVAVVAGKTGSIAKICFSIPVTSDPKNGIRPQVVEALLRARINGRISIIEIFVNDGESAYVAKTIRITEKWETIPLSSMCKDISWGIGIMMVVKFTSPAVDKASEILFSAAGCTIKSNF